MYVICFLLGGILAALIIVGTEIIKRCDDIIDKLKGRR